MPPVDQRVGRRAFVILPIFVLVLLVIVGIYLLKGSIDKDTDLNPLKQTTDCSYTQEEYNDAVSDINEGANINTALPEPTKGWEKDLNGTCVIDGLHEIGTKNIRVVRDLTKCWPDCAVTQDYSDQRISFHIVDNKIQDAKIG